MSDLNTRLNSLEEALEPDGPERQDVTIRIVYNKTVRDPDTGELRSLPGDLLPDSQYDFSDWGDRMPDGRRYRTAYPKDDL
jgi:hypothetical protein